MNTLTEERVSCPYCGESLQVLIELEDAEQKYIEDCQVCCRPITFAISTDMDGDITVSVYDENEAF
jgi:transcription elongation factor Elf1